MTANRELHAVVVIGGQVYGPGYINPPPSDVAERITNPAAWTSVEEALAQAGLPVGKPHTELTAETPTLIGNPPADEITPVDPPETPAQVEAPPRSGKGSGEAAWRAFVEGHDIDVPKDAGREEIIALAEKHKLV